MWTASAVSIVSQPNRRVLRGASRINTGNTSQRWIRDGTAAWTDNGSQKTNRLEVALDLAYGFAPQRPRPRRDLRVSKYSDLLKVMTLLICDYFPLFITCYLPFFQNKPTMLPNSGRKMKAENRHRYKSDIDFQSRHPTYENKLRIPF